VAGVVAAGDVDLVDGLLREGLVGRDGGVLDDLAQPAGQLGEAGRGRGLLGGAGRQRLLRLQLAGPQLGQLGAEAWTRVPRWASGRAPASKAPR
jgi:hypothetical protein